VQSGAELSVHMYMHTHTHMHIGIHLYTDRYTHVDTTHAWISHARARGTRFLHGAGGGRCDSSPMRNIGSNGNGTDISIIIRTDHRLGCAGAPVRTYVRTYVCPSVRSSVARAVPRAPQALLSSLEFG